MAGISNTGDEGQELLRCGDGEVIPGAEGQEAHLTSEICLVGS